jgi:hypothetical protein
MKPFPKNKRQQIKAFFLDPIKRTRFFNQKELKDARTNKQNIFGKRMNVYSANISGRHVFVKQDHFERAQRENLSRLLARHKRLVQNKDLKVRFYDLLSNPYLYADKKVGITQKSSTLSLQGLNSFLEMSKKNQNNFKSHNANLHQAFVSFLKKHPTINHKVTRSTLGELDSNLRAIKNQHGDVSIDLFGSNSLIEGFDDKTGRFKLRLIDQIYPGEEEALTKQYNQKQ